VVAIAALFAAACSVPLVGPKPVEQEMAAIRIVSGATAEQVAQMLTQRGVEFAILSGERDSAWYADVATRADLKSTRPGSAGTTTFAFLGPEAIGDTTLALKVTGGGELRVHDALYRIDKNRRLDLMAVKIEPGANLKESIRALLAYVASDVLAHAAVLLAIEPPTPELGDSVSLLTRAAFADAWECTPQGRDRPNHSDMELRLFYGPAVRMTCARAERVNLGGDAILGHFVLPR
jgi:hypothetical protein